MATQVKDRIDDMVKRKGIAAEELRELLSSLGDPWAEVRGILKKKKINALTYQKKMRRELERKPCQC